LVKNKANAEGWAVTDLQANNTNRTKVTQTLNSTPEDFVVHYDHGGDFVMCGQNNNQFDNAIDNNNVTLLKGKAASTVSCDTAIGLGPLAISTGARAYLGYDDLHWVYLNWTNEFTEAANAANSRSSKAKPTRKHTTSHTQFTRKSTFRFSTQTPTTQLPGPCFTTEIA